MGNENLKVEYQTRKADWERASMYLSSGGTELPEFQEIVKLGPDVIPFILGDICNQQSWIVIALYKITEEKPSKEIIQGRLSSIVQAWILWGDEQGYI